MKVTVLILALTVSAILYQSKTHGKKTLQYRMCKELPFSACLILQLVLGTANHI